MKYSTPYEPPTLTVDAVVFQITNGALTILLMRRPNDPFKDAWALPGGYSARGETTLESLRRIVSHKAGVDVVKDLSYVEQLYTFDTVARDPRGHAVSVTYMGCGKDIVPKNNVAESSFYSIKQLPELAYDHRDIIQYALERLQAKLTYTNAVAAFLPAHFTLSELQRNYEIILDQELDKRNFRKKFLSLGLITETDEMKREGAHRPARLYRFTSNSLESLARSFD